ncbi:hypothetical protein FB565_006403 [Actinoplanes lutulentus]|uniref:Uncharacterized protein DUF3349 n=1 Tax=Actinoplanes lutulentus TaxID=1287878 RepID=A0A327ZBT9_9ACTN|nr:DUF3349 domain-containing protein [Actinoplanes lutulentus]MBB2946635.1 hypothetical protein [Actinoplanes lutulentus]RAK35529.1 uncharacterized protein DUF3349 [Actinoplanes lutulentus]
MDPIADMVATLRQAFPDGIGDDSYLSLLACLYEDMSDENLSKTIALFTGRNRWDVSNDIPRALSARNANREEIEVVAARLRAAGWEPDES